jgi:hypothetical protein
MAWEVALYFPDWALRFSKAIQPTVDKSFAAENCSHRWKQIVRDPCFVDRAQGT